jgi:flagellar biosynthesis/type III secretory pathway M-ring protein FliF/YscJ
MNIDLSLVAIWTVVLLLTAFACFILVADSRNKEMKHTMRVKQRQKQRQKGNVVPAEFRRLSDAEIRLKRSRPNRSCRGG